jgi:catechol 2,3-dioxygenase-like lactoylglutathione lyase family enzyme
VRPGAPHHLDLNVTGLSRARPFYSALLGRLGYEPGDDGDGWCTFVHAEGWYLTLVQTEDRFVEHGFHRKAAGVNHLAFAAPDRGAVDDLHAWLVGRGAHVLYGGPMDMGDAREENYAVFFEDPDRLKLEYVHRGPKAVA